MSTNLTAQDIRRIVQPYIQMEPSISVYERLELYLTLVLKWNAHTNLTSIRDPEQIVRRHFGESLFAAQQLPSFKSLLDFGSGAGFPGIPIQLMHPCAEVTLAESQGKKATFLREAKRSLGLKCSVWAGRVEDLPLASTYDIVTLRAVDNMERAMGAAVDRVASGGCLVVLAGSETHLASESVVWKPNVALPASVVTLSIGSVVPRGTTIK